MKAGLLRVTRCQLADGLTKGVEGSDFRACLKTGPRFHEVSAAQARKLFRSKKSSGQCESC